MEISRSEQKRRMHQLGDLVTGVAELGAAVIRQAPCSEEIRTLLQEAQPLKGAARQRHLKYITKLMTRENSEPLYQFLSARKGSAIQDAYRLHEVEYLRDQLMGEAIEQRNVALEEGVEWTETWQSPVLMAIATQFPSADIAALRRLGFIFAINRNKIYSKEALRLLKAAQEQQRIAEATTKKR